MNLFEALLNNIYGNFVREVNQLTEFFLHVERSIKQIQTKVTPRPGTSSSVRYGLRLLNDSKPLPSELTAETRGEIILEYNRLILCRIGKKSTYRVFLPEMTLSYLLTFQEAFVKDYVYLVITEKKNFSEKPKVWVTGKELYDFRTKDEDEAVDYIAEKETYDLHKMDYLISYLKNNFNLNLRQYSNWDTLKEAKLRRNLIVHNGGKIDKAYRKETGYKGRERKLYTDVAYIENIATIVLDFFEFFDDKMRASLKLPSRLAITKKTKKKTKKKTVKKTKKKAKKGHKKTTT